ncbi:unnamed protein product, partial [Rotaria magnacalcarata]
MILEPFSDDEKFTKKEREEISKNSQNVIEELGKISKDTDNSLTFEEFLEHVNINEEEYIKMIRSEFKKSEVMSTQAIKKFKTEKGKDMLSYEGYIYTLERKTDVKLIFRCQRRDCKGRCHTNPTMDTILSGPTEHCHAPTPDLVPVFELKSKIKARAAETEEFPSTILHSVMRSFPLDAAGQLPQGDTLLRTIRRQRPAPSTNNDNQLPDNLKQTDRG